MTKEILQKIFHMSFYIHEYRHSYDENCDMCQVSIQIKRHAIHQIRKDDTIQN